MMENQKTEEEQATKPPFTKLFKALVWAVGLLVLAFGLSFAYLYTNQEPIKKVITKNLNQQLQTKVSVGSIDIDFFSKFPEVSVKFTNVRADEALEISEQSLFLFKGIYVRFSIWDLLGEDYTIRKLSFDDGEVNLRITPQGKVNYIFWKDPSSKDSTETSIALENVEFNNSKFRYIDEKLKLRLLLLVNHLEVSGAFAEKEFEAKLIGDALFEDLTYKDLDLVDNIEISTNGNLLVDAAGTHVTVNQLELLNLVLSGKGDVLSNSQQWNIYADKSTVTDLLAIVPKKWRPTLSNEEISGSAKTEIVVQILENEVLVKAQAILTNGTFSNKDYQLSLKNISGNIGFNYSSKNGNSTSGLTFTNLTANSKTGTVSASGAIANLLAPNITASGNFSVGVSEILAVARPNMIEKAGGSVSGNFNYQNRFKDWESFTERALSSPNLTGQLAVSGGEMKLTNSNIYLKNISADLTLHNKDIEIERLFLKEDQSEFLIDGWMRNILYIGSNRPVPQLNIRLQSQYVDLDRIMEWQLPKKAETQTAKTETFAMDYRVFLDVKKFNLIRFDGFNLTGEVWNDNLKIKGKNFSFDALDGVVSGNFAWNPEDNGYRFWTQGDLKKINIHKLFNGFKNFGQEWLLAENIYGTGSASIETSMAFDKDMNFLPASLKLVTDLAIDNGRLKGYKPLMSLSSIVDESALEDVQFDHLENQIAIANEVINIPKMEINSTALNLLLLGRHSFDQQIDYSIRLALKDALGKKKKNKKTDLDEWITEVETTDQPYIWVHVGCSIADPCLNLDREMLKKGVKEEIKQQGEDIKNIFKPDANTEPKQDPTKGEVIFEWEEEEPDTNKR